MGLLSFFFKKRDKKNGDDPIKNEIIAKPGDVFIMPVSDDILGACRVIRDGDRHEEDWTGVLPKDVLVALTAWMGTSTPDISEPKLKELLKKTYGNFEGETDFIWINKPIPKEFRRIGSIEPTHEELQVTSKINAGWLWLSTIAREQYKWDNSKDKAVENKYKSTPNKQKSAGAHEKKMVEVGYASCHGCRLLGGWKDGYVWNATEKYLVEKEPDLKEFFSRKELPSLLPNNKKYTQNVLNDENPLLTSKVHWALAYMHHPDPEVVVQLFRQNIPFNIYPLYTEIVWFLLDRSGKVAMEAANAIWRCEIDLEKVLKRLTSKGVSHDQISRACKLLRLSCPDEHKGHLEDLIHGITGLAPIKDNDSLAAKVPTNNQYHASENFIESIFTFDMEDQSDDRAYWKFPELEDIPDLFDKKQFSKIENILGAALANYPDYYFVYSWLSSSKEAQGDFENAKEILEKGIINSKNKTYLCGRMALLEYTHDDLEEAVRWWIRSGLLQIRRKEIDDEQSFLYLATIALLSEQHADYEKLKAYSSRGFHGSIDLNDNGQEKLKRKLNASNHKDIAGAVNHLVTEHWADF